MATISQRISLEGSEDIRKQLEALGDAGAGAFKQIQEAASKPITDLAQIDQATQAFDQLATVSDKLGPQFKALADSVRQFGSDGAQATTQVADGLNESATAAENAGGAFKQVEGGLKQAAVAAEKAEGSLRNVTLESVKASAEIIKLSAEIAKTGVEIGLAVVRHRTFAQELLHLAGVANTALRAISLFTPELALVGVTAGSTGAALLIAAGAFEIIEKAATAAASGYAKSNDSLQILAKNTGQSSASLQQGQAAFEQLGISAEKFGGIITKLNETVSGLNVGDKIKEEYLKVLESEKALLEAQIQLQALGGPRAAVETYQRLRQVTSELAVSTSDLAKAQEDVSKKANAFAINTANSLQKLLPIIQQIEAGQKGLSFDSLVTAEGKINAVIASMKEAATAGKTAGEVLVKFIASADRASAIEVGAKFGITQEDVDRIQNLGGKLNVVDEIWKRIQSAGVLIPPESAASFDRMRVSIQAVDSAWARLKQSLASTFFATEAAKISGDLNTIKAAILNFAAASVETFNRVASSMAGGFQAGIQTTIQEFAAIGAAVTGLGQAMVLVFTDPLQALKALGDGIATLASAIFGVPWNAFARAAVASWNQIVNAVTQAIAAVTNFISVLARIVWDSIRDAGVTAWKLLTDTITGAYNAVVDFASKILTIVWDAISGAGVTAWNALTNAIQAAIAELARFLGLKGGGAVPATGSSARGMAHGGLLGGRGTGTSDSNLAWLSRGEYIMPAKAVRQSGVLAFLEALRRGGGIPAFQTGGLLDSNLFGGFDPAEFARDLKRSLEGIMAAIEAALMEAAAEVGSMSFARGGLLGGRGTGTSDSNLAWVSRGEHIMPARAVRQPGVLAFLEALRRSGGDLERILDGMGRFALGGMVPHRMGIPAFANGGPVGGMNNVTIQFPGVPPVGGLRASAEVVDQLHKAAALAQVRSGGRKPSRYS